MRTLAYIVLLMTITTASCAAFVGEERMSKAVSTETTE